ncbi:hypothetical protein TNCV_3364761, partial [Trichonephila clavipes]
MIITLLIPINTASPGTFPLSSTFSGLTEKITAGFQRQIHWSCLSRHQKALTGSG